MKTMKIIPALSLILFLATGIIANAGNENPKTTMSKAALVKYEVTVILNGNPELNNTYWVVLTDETGRYISAPRVFVPGITKYTFNETAPIWGRIRIANLVVAPNTDPYVGMNTLSTRPDVKIGPFMPGHVYPFILRPQVKQLRDIDR